MELIYRQLSWYMGYLADHARRFFHPAAIQEMLSIFVPLLDGSKLDVSYLLWKILLTLTKDIRAFLLPSTIC